MRRCLTFMAVGAVLSLSSAGQAQERPPSNDAEELRSVGSTLDLIRARNASDYVISTPDGINEARYLTIGGIEQWVTTQSSPVPNSTWFRTLVRHHCDRGTKGAHPRRHL
jgi:hypothetical protein